MKRLSAHRETLLFLVLVLFWGSAYSMMKVGFSYFPPLLYPALMFETAGVVMLSVLFVTGDGMVPGSGREWVTILVGSVLMIAGYHACLFLGQQYTKTVYAAVVVSSSPIVTAFIAGVFLPERSFSTVEMVGLLISFAGVSVLLFGRSPDDPVVLSGIIGIGPVLIFTGVVLFDGGVVGMKRMAEHRLSRRFLTWSMLGGGLLLHGVSAFVAGERMAEVTWNVPSVMIFSYFTIGPTLLGYLIYADLIHRMDVVRLNVVSYFTPICAAVIGFLWLGERPRWSTVAGFGLVVAGFWISQYAEQIPKPGGTRK